MSRSPAWSSWMRINGYGTGTTVHHAVGELPDGPVIC